MKNIPDEKQIEKLLEDLPPQISRRLDQRLSNAPWMGPITNEGEKMNSTQSRPRYTPRVAFATLMILALLSLALATPQGRAFAQELLQLFRRAESHTLPLPQGAGPVPEDDSVPTAAPPAPIVSVAEAETTAGFDAKELPSVPKGFVFAGAMATPGGISIQYEAQGGGGALIINESTEGFMQSEWDQAPVEAISQVQVGDLDAEIVKGGYVVYPGETVARWNPDAAIVRLRWISDGIWFEMAKFGGVESISYLDQNAMINLAENMQ